MPNLYVTSKKVNELYYELSKLHINSSGKREPIFCTEGEFAILGLVKAPQDIPEKFAQYQFKDLKFCSSTSSLAKRQSRYFYAVVLVIQPGTEYIDLIEQGSLYTDSWYSNQLIKIPFLESPRYMLLLLESSKKRKYMHMFWENHPESSATMMLTYALYRSTHDYIVEREEVSEDDDEDFDEDDEES